MPWLNLIDRRPVRNDERFSILRCLGVIRLTKGGHTKTRVPGWVTSESSILVFEEESGLST